MNAERLVGMANQISQFFESQPTREEAITGVHDHIRRSWDPRMRKAIVDYVANGGADLRDVAHEAVNRLAAASAPTTA